MAYTDVCDSDVLNTSVETTRDIVNPKEEPEAFARASHGVGTTRRRTRANSFLFQHFHLAAYDFDSAENFAAQQL
jgi:hypothetical protein